MLRLGDSVRFSGTHEDQAEVGGQRGVVSVDGIKRENVGGRKFENLSARSFELANQGIVLRLGLLEVRGVMKSEVAPCGDLLGIIPPRGTRRAHKDAM